MELANEIAPSTVRAVRAICKRTLLGEEPR